MSKIAKYETSLENSKLLKEMHLPTGEKNNLKDPRNTLFSVHQRGKQKTLWYLSSWDYMEAQNVPTNIELVTYNSKIYPYHSLHRSVMTTLTPEITAKEGYEIRFCDDLFINMIKEYRLSLNEVEIQYGNNKLLNFLLKSNDKWPTMSSELGNKNNLTNWGNKLDATNISLHIPWCYSRDKSDAFPLNLCGHSDRLQHIIEFNLKLSNLLLIRDAEGNDVEFSPELITTVGNVEIVPIPEMEGLYTTQTSRECEFNNCKQDEVNGIKEYFAESSYYVEDENEVVLGKKVQLKVDSKKKSPVHSIYWAAINQTQSAKTKSLCFYAENMSESPIKCTKIETSIGTLMDTKSSYKTERAYLSNLSYRTPDESGFNYWRNSILFKEDMKKFIPGINFGGGNITVTLKEGKNNDKFLVFGLLTHTKKFIFKNYPKNQAERLKIGCTIELDED